MTSDLEVVRYISLGYQVNECSIILYGRGFGTNRHDQLRRQNLLQKQRLTNVHCPPNSVTVSYYYYCGNAELALGRSTLPWAMCVITMQAIDFTA